MLSNIDNILLGSQFHVGIERSHRLLPTSMISTTSNVHVPLEFASPKRAIISWLTVTLEREENCSRSSSWSKGLNSTVRNPLFEKIRKLRGFMAAAEAAAAAVSAATETMSF
ncbi:hypothetical protein HZH68_007423 [Vespula germanica]|uniref:Uncharacterized protein n=1 Tax=Vespula germanica TaxID=30212 RepID=A0A834K7J2_VESGE|nr:hypothetical protein HZH68_007423 [Vespula germanica]